MTFWCFCDTEKKNIFKLQEVAGVKKGEVKVVHHHLPQPPNHEEDKEAGASVCVQEVHIRNRTFSLFLLGG